MGSLTWCEQQQPKLRKGYLCMGYLCTFKDLSSCFTCFMLLLSLQTSSRVLAHRAAESSGVAWGDCREPGNKDMGGEWARRGSVYTRGGLRTYFNI